MRDSKGQKVKVGGGSQGNGAGSEAGVALVPDPAGSTLRALRQQEPRQAHEYSEDGFPKGANGCGTARLQTMRDSAASDGSQSGRGRRLTKAAPLFFLSCNGGRNLALLSVWCVGATCSLEGKQRAHWASRGAWGPAPCCLLAPQPGCFSSS